MLHGIHPLGARRRGGVAVPAGRRRCVMTGTAAPRIGARPPAARTNACAC